MNREERREEILKIIASSKTPVSGAQLSKSLGVSRQVIVQDIAILRVDNKNIFSTSQGYVLHSPIRPKRIFQVCHRDEQIEEELNTIVDVGGEVLDVFVEHDLYGMIKADLLVSTRLEVKNFISNFKDNKISALKNLTQNCHFHTVEADSEEILDIIESELKAKEFLIEG